MTKFEGKVALVTGAASGVGRATARQMVDEGLDLEDPKQIVLDADRVAVVMPLSSIRNE